MKKENLSKHKHIYKITYDVTNNKFYKEKYPVIYINSHYVYYKVNGNDILKVDVLEKIYDNTNSYIKSISVNMHKMPLQYRGLVWNIDDDPLEMFRNRIEEIRKEKEILDKATKKKKRRRYDY